MDRHCFTITEIDFLNGEKFTGPNCQNRSLGPVKSRGNFPEPLERHHGRTTPLWGSHIPNAERLVTLHSHDGMSFSCRVAINLMYIAE